MLALWARPKRFCPGSAYYFSTFFVLPLFSLLFDELGRRGGIGRTGGIGMALARHGKATLAKANWLAGWHVWHVWRVVCACLSVSLLVRFLTRLTL